MIAVAQPKRVLLRLLDGGEEEHVDVAEARVVGGRGLRGQGAFSWGFARPRGILIIRGDGRAKKFTGVDVALFEGGRAFERRSPVVGASPSEVAARVMRNVDVATSTSIEDGPPVHVLDNGAYMEIADGPPVEPEDMPDVGEPDLSQITDRGEDVILGALSGGGRQVARESVRDDFTEELRRRAKAAIGPNGELLDEFDQLSRLQDGERAVLQQQAPWVRSTPPTAMRGLIGSNATVTIGERKRCAVWDGDDSEACIVSVVLGPPSSTTVPLGIILSPLSTVRGYGIVRFGTRGLGIEVEVDIGLGVQFSVPASYISIDVAGEGTANANQQTLTLSGMLSFTSTQRTTNLTRTRFFFVDVGGNSGILRIPTFARDVIVWRSDVASTFVLELLDINNNILISHTQGATEMTTPIVLPIWANQFRVNTVAAASANYSVVFSLAL